MYSNTYPQVCVCIYIYIYTHLNMYSNRHLQAYIYTPTQPGMCVTHTHTYIHVCVMGWLRSVGSIKLQVFVAEYSVFYRALLQKRPVI